METRKRMGGCLALPQSCVYFAQHIQGGPIKIGTSKYLEKRIKALWYPFSGPDYPPFDMTPGATNIRLIGAMLGNHTRESFLHRRFAPHRIYGEWFQAHPDILNFIAKCTVPYDPSDPFFESVVASKQIPAAGSPESWKALRDLSQSERKPPRRRIQTVHRGPHFVAFTLRYQERYTSYEVGRLFDIEWQVIEKISNRLLPGRLPMNPSETPGGYWISYDTLIRFLKSQSGPMRLLLRHVEPAPEPRKVTRGDRNNLPLRS